MLTSDTILHVYPNFYDYPLSKRIQLVRKYQNLEQADVARLMNTDPSRICHLESARRREYVSGEWLRRMAQAMGVDESLLRKGDQY